MQVGEQTQLSRSIPLAIAHVSHSEHVHSCRNSASGRLAPTGHICSASSSVRQTSALIQLKHFSFHQQFSEMLSLMYLGLHLKYPTF
jgi:hypothetical protein